MTERTLREKIADLITEDHLQLLSDFDVDGDIYRQDPECVGSAYLMADAILALLAAQPAPVDISEGGFCCHQGAVALEDESHTAPDAVAEAWQSMDTAPTDGTKFVATNGRLTFTTYALKYYEKFPHEEGGPIYKSRWTAEDGSSVWPWNPTRWTPLPLAKGSRP